MYVELIEVLESLTNAFRIFHSMIVLVKKYTLFSLVQQECQFNLTVIVGQY